MINQLRLRLALLLCPRGGDLVVDLYATLIINGKRTFDSVPKSLQERVRQVLADADCPELAV